VIADALTRALVRLPYLPSPDRVIDAALRLAKPRTGEVLADLGCGDGRVLIRAAKDYGVFAVGFEIHPVLVRLALREVRLRGLQGLVEVVHGDFFQADLSRFHVIYVYPSPSVIKRLAEKLLAECRRDCRVVIHDHLLPDVKPVRVLALPTQGPHVHLIGLYTF